MPRKCNECKKPFKPQYNTIAEVCSVECAIAYQPKKAKLQAKKQRIAEKKQWNAEKRAHRESDRPRQTKLCQDAVNWYVKYIQEAGKGCYTCDNQFNNGQAIHAGHWKTVGAHPEKRFETMFIRRQCYKCNTMNGGRPDVFEKNLRAEYGDAVVDEFVASKPPKMTTPEIVELKKHYLKLNREARKGLAA